MSSEFDFSFTNDIRARGRGDTGYYHPKWITEPSAKINTGYLVVNHMFLDILTPGWRDTQKSLSVAFHFNEKRIYLLVPIEEYPNSSIRSLMQSSYAKRKNTSSFISNSRKLVFFTAKPTTPWKDKLSDYIGKIYPIVILPGHNGNPPGKSFIDLRQEYDNSAVRIKKAIQ